MRIFLRDELKKAGHPFHRGWKNKFRFGKRHKFIFNAYYTRCVETYIRAFKNASKNGISLYLKISWYLKFILDSYSPNFISILPFLSSFSVIALIFLKMGNVCKWTCFAFCYLIVFQTFISSRDVQLIISKYCLLPSKNINYAKLFDIAK